MEELDKLLAAAGLKFINVIVGAVSSFVSLNFWSGLSTGKERWATFIGGWALASWGAPALREWLGYKETLEVGLVLLIGFFGMAVAAEMIKVIRDTDWRGLFRAIVERRWGGGSGQ